MSRVAEIEDDVPMTPAEIIARATEHAFETVAQWHDKNARLCLEVSKDDPRLNADDRRRAFEARPLRPAGAQPVL